MDYTIHSVSAAIKNGWTLLPLIPLSHPSRPCTLIALASALYCRFGLSHQEHDLIAYIPLLAEALLLPLSPAAARLFYVCHPFYILACSLAMRFELKHNQEDLEHALKYYRYILALPPLSLGKIDPLEVADNFTTLLTHEVLTKTATEVQSDVTEKMVRILQMAAATDPSSEHIGPISENAGKILIARLDRCKHRSEVEHTLGVFEEIEKVCPAQLSPVFCILHGVAREKYFFQTNQYDHCRQALVQFNKGLVHLPPEHILRPSAQLGIAEVLYQRSVQDEDPTFLEEAIHHTRAALNTCSPSHSIRPLCFIHLSRLLKRRYMFSGNAEFLREADSYVQEALSQELPEDVRENLIDESNMFVYGFQEDGTLEALAEVIRLQRERLAVIPIGHPHRLDALHALALNYATKSERTRSTADLEEGIHYHSLALMASPPDHYVRRISLIGLGSAFQRRFFLDNHDEQDVRYIDQSIGFCRDALELCPPGKISRSEPLRCLAFSLFIRSHPFGEAGLEESMSLFQSALDEEYTYPHERFVIASQWASCARMRRHPLTALAYETAIR